MSSGNDSGPSPASPDARPTGGNGTAGTPKREPNFNAVLTYAHQEILADYLAMEARHRELLGLPRPKPLADQPLTHQLMEILIVARAAESQAVAEIEREHGLVTYRQQTARPGAPR